MKLIGRRTAVSSAISFLLLAVATSASAECAWVLWTEVTTARSGKAEVVNWVASGVPTARECYSALESSVNKNRSRPGFDWGGDNIIVWHTKEFSQSLIYYCLPDTVDPRGPKGK